MSSFKKRSQLNHAVLLPLTVLSFIFIHWQFGMLLFHTLIELSTVFIGLMMFSVAINTKEFSRNDFLLFLGIGFLFIASLDLLHLLTVPGMNFFPEISIQTTLHFWIYARLFEAIMLICSPIFLTKKLNEKTVLLSGFLVVLAISWLSIVYESPILITKDGLTPFKNNMEYFIIAIMLVTIFFFYQRKSLLSPDVFYYLVSAIILGIFSEFVFTLYVDFHSSAFTLGHLLKFISFFLIYRAIVHTTLTKPFKQLKKVSNSYDIIPHPAIIINSHGIIQSINSAAKEFIKHNNGEVINKNIHNLFHPQGIDKSDCLLCKAYKTNTTINGKTIEYPELNQWIDVYSEKVENQEGSDLFLQLLIDVTENKEAYSKLNQITQQLSYTQENAHIGSWQLDLATGSLWWSDETYNIFDIDKNTSFNHEESFIKMTHPEDRERVDKAFKDSINQQSKYDIEYRLLMSDGRLKYVHEQCKTFYDDTGKATKSFGSVQDITQRHYMSEALNRSEKMDALGKLTGGVAHDFNNLLGVILGFSELLTKELKGNDELTNYTNYINRAASRGADLTRKLLSFSKKQPVKIASANINQLIHSSEGLIKKTLTTQVDFTTKLSPDLWNTQLNINDFDDVILNMCINSLHAMPNGGSLTISTENEHLPTSKARQLDIEGGDYVIVTITDTGFGMSEEIKNKIFDPFFTTKADKGTGLGLSQTYGFIQSSGGAISVQSKIGEGTCFEMYFPRYCVDKEIEKTSIAADDIPKKYLTGNETILVVDDEKALAELAKSILQKYGYKVFVTGSAKEALTLLQDFPNEIKLLISDIIMPEMNGYELADRVKNLYPGMNILLTSGFRGDVNNTYEGIIIDKPYDEFTLLSQTRQTLDSSRLSSNNIQNEHQPCKVLPLSWNKDMSLDSGGIVDQGHQELIEFINKCRRMDRYKLLDDVFYKHIKELSYHMTEHFKCEEHMMKKAKYPFYKNHYDVHRLMEKQLSTISKSQNNQEIYQWIITDFSEWVSEHILGLDKAFISYNLQQKLKEKSKEKTLDS